MCLCERDKEREKGREREFFGGKTLQKVNSMEANEGTAGCCVYSLFCTLSATSLVELHKSLCLLLLQSDCFCVCVGNMCRLFKLYTFPENNQLFSHHVSDRSDFVILYFLFNVLTCGMLLGGHF